MPANVVKTERDEKLWERAKKQVEETYGSTEDRWAIVMHIFQNMKKHSKTGSLRERTIKLAHDKPELREHLLPLLSREAASSRVRDLYNFKTRKDNARFKDLAYIEELTDLVFGTAEDPAVEGAVYDSAEGVSGLAEQTLDGWDLRGLDRHLMNVWSPEKKRLSPKMKGAVLALERTAREIQEFLISVDFLSWS
jgi:hypothetical protein